MAGTAYGAIFVLIDATFIYCLYLLPIIAVVAAIALGIFLVSIGVHPLPIAGAGIAGLAGFGALALRSHRSSLSPAAGTFVLVDRREEAYTVLVRVVDDSQEGIEKVLVGADATHPVEILRWEDFAVTFTGLVHHSVIKDEYPRQFVAFGIREFLVSFPGKPIGLTWTHGVAVTPNDYQHAKDIYQQWKADPAGYEQSRSSRDAGLDPIAPQRQLPPLLGKEY